MCGIVGHTGQREATTERRKRRGVAVPRFLCWLAVLVAELPAAAQQSPARDAGRALATRAELQESLGRLARQGRSSEAALIRARLDSGDFQPGDRILVRIEGEAALSDTFTVRPGPTLTLPPLGGVPLAGVLRSELPGLLETHLAHYLRDPSVQVRPLIRILIEGEVARPGFYAVPPELALADAIGLAGGLSQRAKPTGIRVERGSDVIWSGDPLQQALGRGLTLDQLSLRAGDRLFVPAHGDFARTAGLIGGLLAIPVSIYIVTRNRR